MAATVLSRQLSGEVASERATALDAFELARRMFVAGERIEMGRIANELGTSRVTLHRWVGSRDLLICEVAWSLVEPVLREARRRTAAVGGQAIADTMERFLVGMLDSPPAVAFLKRESEIALRIFTTKRTEFQSRLVAFFCGELVIEADAGHIAAPLPLPVEDLAYLIVRIGESFFYCDTIAGGEPDAAKAGQAIAALLR